MNSPDSLDPRQMFRRVVPEKFLHELCEQQGYGLREGIFSAGVVIWLMIWQRLQGNGSMAAAVQYLVQSDRPGLQSGCLRWTVDKVSAGTARAGLLLPAGNSARVALTSLRDSARV